MSALFCAFYNQIFENCNIIHSHIQADHHVLCKHFKTCCDLEKYQGHPILATLCVQRLYVQFILLGGLLTSSDMMAKIDTVWLTFVSLRPVVTLKI